MKKIFYALICALVVLSSCNDDDDGPTTASLSLNISGLESLGTGFIYEGWVIVNGSPVSTGTFSVSSTGSLSQTSFDVEMSDLNNAADFVLSIEPVPDSDPGPAATKILVGSFSNGSASLATGIVGDFSSAAGAFFLRSPTDESGTNNGNDEFGIWFGDPTTSPPSPNFTLPTLPGGWKYEGWVVGESGPLTTGKFTTFNVVDEADPFSETMQPGPPIPGEDYFLNAPSGESFPLDLRGRTVVISVEPDPDDSDGPFVLKPLVVSAGQDTAPTVYNLAQNLGSFPTGTASF